LFKHLFHCLFFTTFSHESASRSPSLSRARLAYNRYITPHTRFFSLFLSYLYDIFFLAHFFSTLIRCYYSTYVQAYIYVNVLRTQAHL